MASLSTGSSRSLKWLSITPSAFVLLIALWPAAPTRAQIGVPEGYANHEAWRRSKPSGTPSGLGRLADKEELVAWDISIAPDGKELPAGSGTPAQGAAAFHQRSCSVCHGTTGSEGPGPTLVETPTGRARIKHYPFAPTIWDFIRRAMPFDRAGVLSNDEVYALTAFLLFRNGIIEETDVMDAKSLARVRMPDRAAYTPPPDWKPGQPRNFKILP